jgi:hypothetical protein
MVAYNFKPQFAEAVERGSKCQTIRPPGRRRHAVPGQMLQLYTGMRTPVCRLLRIAPCTISTGCSIFGHMAVVEGWRLLGNDLEIFARDDGFASWSEMMNWFREAYGLPCEGHLIGWNPNQSPPQRGKTDVNSA